MDIYDDFDSRVVPVSDVRVLNIRLVSDGKQCSFAVDRDYRAILVHGMENWLLHRICNTLKSDPRKCVHKLVQRIPFKNNTAYINGAPVCASTITLTWQKFAREFALNHASCFSSTYEVANSVLLDMCHVTNDCVDFYILAA